MAIHILIPVNCIVLFLNFVFVSYLLGLGIVDCRWSMFSEWSQCSKSCGWGVKKSERKIIQISSHGGKDCEGQATRTEKCNNQPCAGTLNYYETFFQQNIFHLG